MKVTNEIIALENRVQEVTPIIAEAVRKAIVNFDQAKALKAGGGFTVAFQKHLDAVRAEMDAKGFTHANGIRWRFEAGEYSVAVHVDAFGDCEARGDKPVATHYAGRVCYVGEMTAQRLFAYSEDIDYSQFNVRYELAAMKAAFAEARELERAAQAIKSHYSMISMKPYF